MMTRVSILVSLVACVGPRPRGDAQPATLSIAPATSVLLLAGGAPASQAFTATLTDAAGAQRDVTADTTFAIDNGFGSFTGNQLTMIAAGQAAVQATWTDQTASATVIARLYEVRVDPALPTNTPDLFTGPEVADAALAVLYPSDGVWMPRNLGDFELHWTASGLDIFEASLKSDYADVRVYVPGGNGLAAAGPNASWAELEAAEWTAAIANDDTATFEVRGVSSVNPGIVHASAAGQLHASNEAMQGGIYYWASTAPQGSAYGLFRHDMAAAGVAAEEYLTTDQTGGRCIACHSLSRDGTRMAAAYDGGPNAVGALVDVATRAVEPSTNRWDFSALSPDGKQLFAIEGYTLTVRDADTQAVLATMTETPVTHPEVSPDGTRLAYVHPTTLAWDWMFGGGQIYTRSYDPVTHAFGPEQPLVTTGANNYYPSWSPDGQWIVFNRSDDATGTGAYDNPTATVWVVKADGSSPPIQLTAANQGLGLTNSWARFAPFEQTAGPGHDRLFWITVSSKRDFGTRLVNTGLADTQKTPQLWMMAFFPDDVGMVPDPSARAFRLPFQSLATHNHAAQWTEQVVVIE